MLIRCGYDVHQESQSFNIKKFHWHRAIGLESKLIQFFVKKLTLRPSRFQQMVHLEKNTMPSFDFTLCEVKPGATMQTCN